MSSILVVDDSRVMLSVVETHLSGVGVPVTLAQTPEEALSIAQSSTPGVLITDVNMPTMDGIELARRVKRLSAGRTFVVLITAAATDDARLAYEAGVVDAFFPKPLDGYALRRAIDATLAKAPPLRDVRIRVVAADDTRVGRRLMERILLGDPELELCAMATDGKEAVELAARHRPDLVLLDAMMPELNGIEATRAIRSMVATRVVIVSDYLASRAAGLAFEATRVGALDVVAKPQFSDPGGPVATAFRQRLKDLAGVPIASQHLRLPRPTPRRLKVARPSLVVIGGSTGSPGVLSTVLARIAPHVHGTSIVVAIHLLEGFEPALAQWLYETSAVPVDVAGAHSELVSGRALLAPARRHLEIESRGHATCVDGSARFTPSIDRVFTSAARVYGPEVLAIILSGMGDDGTKGLERVYAAGGSVYAQSPESCAVSAMPASAIEQQVVDRVLSPVALGAAIAGVLDDDA